MPVHTYHINLNERGYFSADVRTARGETVYEIHDFEIFEDGFMDHANDTAGLQEHLLNLGVFQPGDYIGTEAEAEAAIEAEDEEDRTPMFYVIKTEYVGPNMRDEQWIDWDRVEVSTIPARTNSSREIRTEGWCGTTNDIAVHAYGEFDTEDAARKYIRDNWPCREQEVDAGNWENLHINAEDGTTEQVIVARYKIGKYEQLTANASANWCYATRDDITADTTDERINEIIATLEATANEQFETTLNEDAVREMLTERRDELIQERDDEDTPGEKP